MFKKISFIILIGLFLLGSLNLVFTQEEKLSIFEVKIEDKDAPTLLEEFSFYRSSVRHT